MTMKIMTRLAITLIATLLYSNVHASWSPSTINLFKSKSKQYIHLQNAGFTSLWGGVKRRFSNSDQKGERLEVDLGENFKTKKLEVYFFEGKKKGPLNVFFPGVFGSVDGALAPAMINLLEKFPGHVLVIPNFLSVTYIKSDPIYTQSPEQLDITVAQEIINSIILKIPDEKLQGINLFAESLGSFVAAAVLSRISNNKKLIKHPMKITLMWPPSNLSLSLKNFDVGISKSLKKYESCGFVTNAVKVGYYFLYQDIPKDMSKEFIECMESYMYHFAFVESIENSFEAYMDTKKIKDEKLPKDFKTFFSSYNKAFADLIKNNAPELKIKYWLKRRNFENTEVRIITSQNDFINTGVDWNKVIEESYLGKNNIIILPWGGHSGGLAMPIWEEVFGKEIFNVKI
jgi:hypothetical protein